MKIESGIYHIVNIINGKEYIGSSINTRKRKNRHFSELRRGLHKNRKLQNSFNKYGESGFTYDMLEIVENHDLLIEREQHYLDTRGPILNINKIANSSLGVKRSEETKERIRQANLGLKHPEWRNKIKSDAQGGDNHWTKDKGFSDDSKKKMSDTHKKLYEGGYVNPHSKVIKQMTLDGKFIKEWGSITEASVFYEIDRMAIANCVNGKTKTSCGFKWELKK